MLESEVEKKLVQGVKKMGGLCLKWVSPGFAGVPDRIVILPGGTVFFVELKQDRGRLSPRQKVVHKKLKELGISVITIYGALMVQDYLEDWRRWYIPDEGGVRPRDRVRRFMDADN